MHRNKRKKWRAVSCRIWHYPTHCRERGVWQKRAEVMHGFNVLPPPSAIALAREAELGADT